MECMTTGVESNTERHPIRTFVAVSGEPQQAQLHDVLSADESDYGVILIDSIARSYSRIKQIIPDVVIVYCAINDIAACQLLSMLQLDGELSRVRVVTCATVPANGEFTDFPADMLEATPEMARFLSIN